MSNTNNFQLKKKKSVLHIPTVADGRPTVGFLMCEQRLKLCAVELETRVFHFKYYDSPRYLFMWIMNNIAFSVIFLRVLF